MVIASGLAGARRLLLLGLTGENVQRLKAGQPIRLTPETHPGCPEGLEIGLLYGETELAIADALMGDGAIDEATRVIAVVRSPEGAQ